MTELTLPVLTLGAEPAAAALTSVALTASVPATTNSFCFIDASSWSYAPR